MSLIQISDLSFTYDGSYDPVFEHVSLSFDTNWKLGLIGRNGRGKTTLIKLLQGKYGYHGTITSTVQFSKFPFPICDSTQMTFSLVDAMAGDYEYWQLIRELSLLQTSEDILYRPFQTLSHGEQLKVQLAALFLNQHHFLLIDEPTNHLDMAGRKLVSNYLASKEGFLLVSHDRAFLDGCVDHILAINRTGFELQKGNFSSWQKNKQKRDEHERVEQKKLKKQAKKLEVAVRQTAQWSDQVEKTKHGSRNSGLRPDTGYIGHKSAKMMKRAKSIEKRRTTAMEQAEHLLKDIESCESLKLFPLVYHSDRLAEMRDISVEYSGRRVLEAFSLEIRKGDRICLRGKNGCGKSSILKLLSGDPIPYSGHFQIGTDIKISYVAQDTNSLSGSLSEYAQNFQLEESQLKTILRKFDFSRIHMEKDLSELSEGQKKKVLLARSLCEKAHLYLWDEPLNYIDMFSRIQIEEVLRAYQPTLVFIEHDQSFAQTMGTKFIDL